MSSVHTQKTGSDSGVRAQPTSSDEIPRPEPEEMSQTGTGRGSGNTTTGDDLTRVDEMPIEVQQEVYVLPAASHRMARVVQQEVPIYREEWPMPEMARVVSRRIRSRSRSRSSGGGREVARPSDGNRRNRSRNVSRSRSRIRDDPEMVRVISRSRSRSRQRGKRHCMSFCTRRRGLARVVDGVSAPRSREKGSHSELFGYREYSSLLATDSDFLVFKRFGASNARVLLALQDDVMRKERTLADIEMAARQSEGPEKESIHIARLNNEEDNPIGELYRSLDRYNKFLIQVAEIGKWPTAEKVNIRSLKTWHSHHPGAIAREETTYLDHTADLFRLLPRNAEPLRKFLERWDRFTFFSL